MFSCPFISAFVRQFRFFAVRAFFYIPFSENRKIFRSLFLYIFYLICVPVEIDRHTCSVRVSRALPSVRAQKLVAHHFLVVKPRLQIGKRLHAVYLFFERFVVEQLTIGCTVIRTFFKLRRVRLFRVFFKRRRFSSDAFPVFLRRKRILIPISLYDIRTA